MSLEAIFVAVVIVTMLAVLATGRIATDLVMLGVVGLFVVTRVFTVEQAFRGFATAGLLTVAFLYVVAAGLHETGGMNLLTSRLLGRPRTPVLAQTRLVLVVTAVSAVLNNTPVVAAFLPVVRALARVARVPGSRLFMPLSFAAILGGVCTLIGTSTNLVVYSLIESYNARHDAPLPQLSFFTLTPVGVPIALAGLAYMLLLGRRLLPDRSAQEAVAGEPREYMLAMQVRAGSPIAGRTIEQAGLRHLPGLFLSRIDREEASVVAVGPEEVVREGDTLVFVGALESVVDLQGFSGLVPVTDEGAVTHYRPKMRLVEVVISPDSPLVGQTIRDAEVRTRYGAVVVAVHRQGSSVPGRLGDIALRPGDTLLLETDPGFARRHSQSRAFYLVSEVAGAAAPRHERAWIAIAILIGLIAVMSGSDLPVIRDLPIIGGMPEAAAAMCAALAMILFRCCTGPQARAGIEWSVLVVIGLSFGLASAMENTGLASFVAGTLTDAAAPLGPWGLIGVTYLVTLMFTTLITNNAAAALMFPIAAGIAGAGGYSFTPFAVTICLAASLEFMTPLGYQTNLMVMGPGGYRFGDFFRFGGPLTALCASVSIALVPLVFPLRS